MIPPDKGHLHAMAGWSLSAEDRASPEQKLALCHFRAGCGDLAKVIETLPLERLPQDTTREEQWKPRDPEQALAVMSRLVPVGLEDIVRPPTGANGECLHRFDIHSQKCKFCGISYRKAHGRDPELM